MSFQTRPAFVHQGDWSGESDNHPAMKWMHEYTNEYDKGDFDAMWSSKKYLTSDFQYSKSDGTIYPRGQESWDAVKQSYSFFTSYYHEPYFLVCYELDDKSGWAMIGDAWLYCNLPGDAKGTEVKDQKGRNWQMRVPGGFHFIYKKQDGGIRLATTAITSDSGPVVVALLQRGIMTPADLAGVPISVGYQSGRGNIETKEQKNSSKLQQRKKILYCYLYFCLTNNLYPHYICSCSSFTSFVFSVSSSPVQSII